MTHEACVVEAGDSENIQSEGCKRASWSLLTADPLKAMSGYMLGAEPLETLLVCTPSPPGRLSVKIMHQEGCRSHGAASSASRSLAVALWGHQQGEGTRK